MKATGTDEQRKRARASGVPESRRERTVDDPGGVRRTMSNSVSDTRMRECRWPKGAEDRLDSMTASYAGGSPSTGGKAAFCIEARYVPTMASLFVVISYSKVTVVRAVTRVLLHLLRATVQLVAAW